MTVLPIVTVPFRPNVQPEMPGTPAVILSNCGRPDGRELQVHGDIPVLAVKPGSVDQVQQVRAERDGGRHRRHGEHQAGRGAAHRHRAAPVARIEGQPHSGHDRHRGAGAGQPPGGLRAVGRRSRRVPLRRPARRRQPPGRPAHPREQHGHGSRKPGGKDAHVSAEARIRLGETGRADRHQRGGRDRRPARQGSAGRCRHADLHQARRHQLAAGHPERGERPVVRRSREQQPGCHLAYHEQRGDREDQRE